MSAHTPGPWSQERGCEVYGNDSRPIVDCCECDRPRAEYEANARLIAAAPYMYEALREIAEGCVERRPGHVDYGRNRTKAEIVGIARAALARAEGRS